MPTSIILDGASLRVEDVIAVARGFASVSIQPAAMERLGPARRVVEDAVRSDDAVY
ncbi:MAG: histidine ammonia-lyase, partial [Gemmatimonadetes bacterium]|nr:histidine ammonia-lyase [Gemmatimonadota bacterium]